MTETEQKEIHLVVCAHGLWGNPNHMGQLIKKLKEKHDKTISVLNSKENSATTFTYDGIDVCGDRLVNEIKAKIDELEKDNFKITKFSIIGYSLGGLIARYAIGILYEEGLFNKIKPWLFTTFATPHLGIRREDTKPFIKIFNWVSSKILSRSGEQLQLIDKYEGDHPIIVVLSDPERIFYKALSMFQHLFIYANTKNDRTVPFWTAAVTESDPFENFEELELSRNERYDGIIESYAVREEEDLPSDQKFIRLGKNIPSYALVAVALPVILPVWFTLALSIVTVQGLISRYRVKTIIENRLKKSKGKEEAEESFPAPEVAVTERDSIETTATARTQGLVPMTAEQRRALINMNQLKFKKYSVHIDSLNAHAAIVVRNQRFNRKAGERIIEHFVEETFKP